VLVLVSNLLLFLTSQNLIELMVNFALHDNLLTLAVHLFIRAFFLESFLYGCRQDFVEMSLFRSVVLFLGKFVGSTHINNLLLEGCLDGCVMLLFCKNVSTGFIFELVIFFIF
jgi:hypothetical protein